MSNVVRLRENSLLDIFLPEWKTITGENLLEGILKEPAEDKIRTVFIAHITGYGGNESVSRWSPILIETDEKKAEFSSPVCPHVEETLIESKFITCNVEDGLAQFYLDGDKANHPLLKERCLLVQVIVKDIPIGDLL